MQSTTELYKKLLSTNYRVETRLAINGTDPDYAYGMDTLISMKTARQVFAESTPRVGCCVSGEITVEMLKPAEAIPKRAKLVPFIRLTDGTRYSEWIQKGVYYIDTRKTTEDGTSIKIITFNGFDDMLKTEQDYPASTLEWPARDIDVVNEIAKFIGVGVDPRTAAIMTDAYPVQYPSAYTCRETLGYIAAMYGGCFVMSDLGELLLVVLGDAPDVDFLGNEDGYLITFGGEYIIV